MAIDLMEKMLEFDPRKRINVEDALKHPWLAQLHDEAAEPSAPGVCVWGEGVCVCGRGVFLCAWSVRFVKVVVGVGM